MARPWPLSPQDGLLGPRFRRRTGVLFRPPGHQSRSTRCSVKRVVYPDGFHPPVSRGPLRLPRPLSGRLGRQHFASSRPRSCGVPDRPRWPPGNTTSTRARLGCAAFLRTEGCSGFSDPRSPGCSVKRCVKWTLPSVAVSVLPARIEAEPEKKIRPGSFRAPGLALSPHPERREGPFFCRFLAAFGRIRPSSRRLGTAFAPFWSPSGDWRRLWALRAVSWRFGPFRALRSGPPAFSRPAGQPGRISHNLGANFRIHPPQASFPRVDPSVPGASSKNPFAIQHFHAKIADGPAVDLFRPLRSSWALLRPFWFRSPPATGAGKGRPLRHVTEKCL